MSFTWCLKVHAIADVTINRNIRTIDDPMADSGSCVNPDGSWDFECLRNLLTRRPMSNLHMVAAKTNNAKMVDTAMRVAPVPAWITRNTLRLGERKLAQMRRIERKEGRVAAMRAIQTRNTENVRHPAAGAGMVIVDSIIQVSPTLVAGLLATSTGVSWMSDMLQWFSAKDTKPWQAFTTIDDFATLGDDEPGVTKSTVVTGFWGGGYSKNKDVLQGFIAKNFYSNLSPAHKMDIMQVVSNDMEYDEYVKNQPNDTLGSGKLAEITEAYDNLVTNNPQKSTIMRMVSKLPSVVKRYTSAVESEWNALLTSSIAAIIAATAITALLDETLPDRFITQNYSGRTVARLVEFILVVLAFRATLTERWHEIPAIFLAFPTILKTAEKISTTGMIGKASIVANTNPRLAILGLKEDLGDMTADEKTYAQTLMTHILKPVGTSGKIDYNHQMVMRQLDIKIGDTVISANIIRKISLLQQGPKVDHKIAGRFITPITNVTAMLAQNGMSGMWKFATDELAPRSIFYLATGLILPLLSYTLILNLSRSTTYATFLERLEPEKLDDIYKRSLDGLPVVAQRKTDFYKLNAGTQPELPTNTESFTAQIKTLQSNAKTTPEYLSWFTKANSKSPMLEILYLIHTSTMALAMRLANIPQISNNTKKQNVTNALGAVIREWGDQPTNPTTWTAYNGQSPLAVGPLAEVLFSIFPINDTEIRKVEANMDTPIVQHYIHALHLLSYTTDQPSSGVVHLK